jgi:hypothetical protein
MQREETRSVEAYVAVPKRYGEPEGSERADGLAYVVPAMERRPHGEASHVECERDHNNIT